MERCLLFIRDAGQQDRTDLYASRLEARKALAACARMRSEVTDTLALPGDDASIAAYFARDAADYDIDRVRKPAPRPGIPS